MKASKKPKFLCDNCGTEVDKNANSCPRCGRFFSSVRCPKCGFSADESSFQNGCPSCGYSAPLPAAKSAPPPAGKKVHAGKLPLWVYVLSVFAFIVTVAILVYIVVK